MILNIFEIGDKRAILRYMNHARVVRTAVRPTDKLVAEERRSGNDSTITDMQAGTTSCHAHTSIRRYNGDAFQTVTDDIEVLPNRSSLIKRNKRIRYGQSTILPVHTIKDGMMDRDR